MKTLTLAAVAALFPVAALAHDGMHINDAYARSANPKTGAIFLTLENHRKVACSLQSVASDAADRVELHSHSEENGVMRMGAIEGGITVPAGGTHQLARGGDHVMLMGLTRPLADGDSIDLTLDFGDCGSETTTAVVDNQREDAAAEHGDHAGH
ncbi:copper chaperone PCu(A)C [Paracoccus beibuensis]|uniref:copper chaperone PCu(A)C n=1 Tax=Paracoccus beibuensis TaxID=547602 RepID=UPI00223F3F93|nr:copper chaperone PCu(A)C [Paracoccus beibuensis]